MSGIVSISSNEEVSARVSDRYRKNQRSHARGGINRADLASTEDVQLLIHLCSSVAISSGASILKR